MDKCNGVARVSASRGDLKFAATLYPEPRFFANPSQNFCRPFVFTPKIFFPLSKFLSAR